MTHTDLIDGWDDLKDNLPSDGHKAAELLFDYGDNLADALTAAQERIEVLEGALRGITEHGALQDREYLSAELNDKLDIARAALDAGKAG